jgi:hypothetical protein
MRSDAGVTCEHAKGEKLPVKTLPEGGLTAAASTDLAVSTASQRALRQSGTMSQNVNYRSLGVNGAMFFKRIAQWWREQRVVRLLNRHARKVAQLGYAEVDPRCAWNEHAGDQAWLIQAWQQQPGKLAAATAHPHAGLAQRAVEALIKQPSSEITETLTKCLMRPTLKQPAAFGLYLVGGWNDATKEVAFEAVGIELIKAQKSIQEQIIAAFHKRPDPAIVKPVLMAIKRKLEFKEPAGILSDTIIEWHQCSPVYPPPKDVVARYVVADINAFTSILESIWESIRTAVGPELLAEIAAMPNQVICVVGDGERKRPGYEWTQDDESRTGHSEPPPDHFQPVYFLGSINFSSLRMKAIEEQQRRAGQVKPKDQPEEAAGRKQTKSNRAQRRR